MFKKIRSCLVCSILLLSSCETDLDVNAPWKQIPIAFGLLDQNQDHQYIKVNKAFLNNGKSARAVAKDQDSLYHQENIEVLIKEYSEANSLINEWTLNKDTLNNKESGTFANPEQILYKTPNDFQIDANNSYELVIKNENDKTLTKARTAVVDSISNLNAFLGSAEFNFRIPQLAANAFFYDMKLQMHYYNVDRSNNDKTEKTLNWKLFSLNQTFGSEFEKKVKTQQFYNVVESNLSKDPDIIRPVDSLKVDAIITGGSEELYNYIEVNQPATGIVQKNPDYTNLSNGKGIFASRSIDTIPIIFPGALKDSLIASETTKGLNFTR